MKQFLLTNAAKKDLKGILKYTEKNWGREQRNIYLKQFDETFELLAGSPEIGFECDYIKVGYMKFPQGSHIIYYTEGSESKILVIRILHGAMDEKKNMLNS